MGRDGIVTLDDPAGIAAAICRRRLTAWEILAGLSERSEDWAAHLPERLTGLTGAAGWFQEEWRPDGVLLLEGLVRRAERRGTADLEDLALDSAVAAGPLLVSPGTLRPERISRSTPWREARSS